MTGTSLIAALSVGIVLGTAARWLVPACRGVPFWLPLAVGVGAAISGTVAVRLAGVDTSRVSLVELVVQVALAGLGVAAVAMTAESRPSTGRYGKGSKSR